MTQEHLQQTIVGYGRLFTHEEPLSADTCNTIYEYHLLCLSCGQGSDYDPISYQDYMEEFSSDCCDCCGQQIGNILPLQQNQQNQPCIEWTSMTPNEKIRLLNEYTLKYPVYDSEQVLDKAWIAWLKKSFTELHEQLAQGQEKEEEVLSSSFHYPVLCYSPYRNEWMIFTDYQQSRPFDPLTSLDDALFVVEQTYPLGEVILGKYSHEQIYICAVWPYKEDAIYTKSKSEASTRSEALIKALIKAVSHLRID